MNSNKLMKKKEIWVDKMILYIYKVTNFTLHWSDFKNCENININSHDDELIEGNISIETSNIDFIFKCKSNLLFLNAEKRSEKRKAFKILYGCFQDDINLFMPNFSKERDMICQAPNKSVKFLHNNKLESKKILTNKYCEGMLEEDYYLFEVNLKYEEFSFLYYRNAIKFKNNVSKYKMDLIKLIERYLGE